ncbi:extracellular serine-rich protein [Rhizophagus clarus]|uniref:Extracellular serine-rich protein n=1 Tax=Rhizophagus clarus TaxID=94130 RepID=A0A8H3LAF6_9GLOM|nr:extracellular serine-rich protein [Rhizophagus clarus]
MISKKLRILLLISIFVIQIILVKSQTYSVDPILPPGNPNPTDPPISLTNHVIKVGFMHTGFSRNNFTASKGNVLFWLWEGDGPNLHSVVESTLENPCQSKVGGFNLGQHSEPYNVSMAVPEDRTYVFFSDVADDCKKGMYGGINLPQGYTWPKDLTQPPQQIVTTPLNPTPTPTVTGSMSIAAEGAESTSTSKSKSDSSSTYYLKESSFGNKE